MDVLEIHDRFWAARRRRFHPWAWLAIIPLSVAAFAAGHYLDQFHIGGSTYIASPLFMPALPPPRRVQILDRLRASAVRTPTSVRAPVSLPVTRKTKRVTGKAPASMRALPAKSRPSQWEEY